MAAETDLERLAGVVRAMVGDAWDESALDPEHETVTLDFDGAPRVFLEADSGNMAAYAELLPYPVDPEVRLDFLTHLLRLNRPGGIPDDMRLFLLDDMAALTFILSLDDVQPATLAGRLNRFAGTAATLAHELQEWLQEWADAGEEPTEEEFDLTAAPEPIGGQAPQTWMKA